LDKGLDGNAKDRDGTGTAKGLGLGFCTTVLGFGGINTKGLFSGAFLLLVFLALLLELEFERSLFVVLNLGIPLFELFELFII
jgi:hypothetical protein